MHPDAPSARRPGRCWTIRVVGHRDRTASVTCSSACAMPPRSRDLAALRRFAEAHAAAHARAAAVHHDAACWCRRQRCAPHEDVRVSCAGTVVLVLRHDPSVGQVWTLSEVCSACASLMPHTRVLSRGAPPRPRVPDPAAARDAEPEANPRTGGGPAGVPGSGAGREAHGGPAPSGPAMPAAGPARLVPGGFSAPSSGAGPERGGVRRRPVGGRRGRPGAGGGAG
ncbi:hypothetical protein ACWGH3_01265 [Streptomyces sp. NPDC054884]|uniref:hypothetical protein n=1 Tax=Streptomyces sp. ME08-AFT2 TaxID=3028683 RepID=UPI0029AEA4F8|nr:hypothetical protein [Streptomyces sp. ME08-AFT2]MDX3311884.1 hypothetical protein [Streptomyces sp. ME08-AFT2]